MDNINNTTGGCIPPYQSSSVCPTCGHCPTCGRGGWGTYPYWPSYPYITWISGTAGNLTTGSSENPNLTGTQTWKEQPTTLT